VKVLPQVKSIYEGMEGQELPLLTRMMLAVSDFVIADLVWVHLFCFNANLIKKQQ
jgi:type II secretory pathway component PulF